jgi:dTMP kinase
MTDHSASPQARKPAGHLIAFEGLDQSGKQTQA